MWYRGNATKCLFASLSSHKAHTVLCALCLSLLAEGRLVVYSKRCQGTSLCSDHDLQVTLPSQRAESPALRLEAAEPSALREPTSARQLMIADGMVLEVCVLQASRILDISTGLLGLRSHRAYTAASCTPHGISEKDFHTSYNRATKKTSVQNLHV